MVSKEIEAAQAVVNGVYPNITGGVPVVAPLVDATRAFAFPPGIYVSYVKPLIDRVVGLIALVLCTPLYVVLGLAIWVAMDSPVFLAQERVGRRGRVFRLWKFRTMEPDRRSVQLNWVGEDRRKTHKSAEDPRITGLGRWLRATRLDETPQFLNVVLGDLSLVGPRPEIVSIVAEYEPWQHRRHAVKPGVTGLWQISDTGEALLRDCTEMELAYLDDVSLKTDLAIILRTFPALLRRSGI
ncbi:MAG TPA: sugar transferase [Acidimicrobiia bacterium]|nr:sugar transferase [Acidimicrobiia bacterium]